MCMLDAHINTSFRGVAAYLSHVDGQNVLQGAAGSYTEAYSPVLCGAMCDRVSDSELSKICTDVSVL